MHLVDGSVPSLVTSDPLWYENDQMLLSWINATLNESILPYLIGVSFSKKAWDLLKQSNSKPSQISLLPEVRLSGMMTSSSSSLMVYHHNTASSVLQSEAGPVLTALPIDEVHMLLICEELIVTDNTPHDTSSAQQNQPNGMSS
ncbi:hypothetical protein NE237_024444 [Protea cynaroides]|uniref:Uncharacterized protein n=1 Tax=Protea cynaroides TaxID=273540 RepID=A0A9Q0K6S5_9MAGN|nr:hypothetical protein NE237_024444 [Protea cynaroides]